MPATAKPPHDSDEFFAAITALMAEGRSLEAYEYKTHWYPFVMAGMSTLELRRLANIDAEFFLSGHVPSARQRSHFPEAIDPSLTD